MLILLPPSEGKTATRRGAPVDFAGLSSPELNDARREVGEALVRLAADPDRARAREVLGISGGQDGELDKDAALFTAPASAAAKLYSGVLYEALGLSTLDSAAKRRATSSVRVFSGLWGMVGTADRIPPYRCSMNVRLPGIGSLAGFWRRHLATVMPALVTERVVLDLRSSPYIPAWRPGPADEQVVTVRVLQERLVGGEPTRTVVSHFNKATKGRLVRDLLIAGVRPKKAAELLDAMRDLGYHVEGDGPGRADVVVSEL
ncbi:peroxide stress protein YaaA [Phytomonospora sp. NPDC050363]|uniref:peroxide stress protein YaaA n=1 Tax=Phytomonospora sp. NPDC050363 TaxID=3155642 RepID=UPI0033D79E63